MQINVSTRHGHLSEASQEKIRAKAEKLTRIFDRLTAIDITVDVKDSDYPLVDMRVSAEHKHDFVATQQSSNLMACVDGAIHKLEQQLRKYKERIQQQHRDPGQRRQEAAPQAESERT